MGIDIWGIDILGVDILGIDILALPQIKAIFNQKFKYPLYIYKHKMIKSELKPALMTRNLENPNRTTACERLEINGYLRVIIYKHQNFPIEAGNDMSQNCLKLCVFLSYVK